MLSVILGVMNVYFPPVRMDVDVAKLFLFPNVVLGFLQVTLTIDTTKGHLK
jgi:hypothetical protein